MTENKVPSSLVVVGIKAIEPLDMIQDLTWSAWNALRQENIMLKPVQWSRLQEALLNVFRARTRVYESCGESPECRHGFQPALFEGGLRSEPRLEAVEDHYYLLEIREGPENFVRSLAEMVVRMFCGREKRRQAAEERVLVALRKVISNYLVANERCAACPARKGFPERRIWGPRNV
jgi:hypothetical protein